MTDNFGDSAKILYKKVLGTSVLLTAIVVAILIGTGRANAIFTFINGNLQMSGTVVQTSGASFMIDTGGTYTFPVIVDSNTNYSGPYASLADLNVGDTVLIAAREDQGNVLAENVGPTTSNGYGYGYGNGCESLRLENVWVSDRWGEEWTFSRSGVTFMVAVGDYTDVVGGSFDDIANGDVVTIVGNDCGDDGFEANSIVTFQDDPVALCDDRSELSYVVYNDVHLLSHDEGGAFSPVYDATIPAGTYNVYGVTYDDHANNTWDTSILEQWQLEGWANGTQTYTSNPTVDLPDATNRNISTIGTAVTIDGFDQLRFVHANYPEPNYNSFVPECVILEPVESGDDEVVAITEVLSCEVVPAGAQVIHNAQTLLSHDQGGAFSPIFPATVADGTYDVYGVSHDEHSQNPWDTFGGEQWSFTGYTGTNAVYTSGVTDDLPDNLDRNVTNIGSGVAMASVDGISFEHASYPNPDYLSVLPECVVLVPTE